MRKTSSISIFFLSFLLVCACQKSEPIQSSSPVQSRLIPLVKSTSLIILGNLQDAGQPHIGCKKDCCKELFGKDNSDRMVVSLGLYDAPANKRYLFEATPDLPQQMKMLSKIASPTEDEIANGIFITHAHVGHYTGLMYLGKEAINAKDVPVYVMPRMKTFLENNGPWSQLVTDQNIEISALEDKQYLQLSNEVSVSPFVVPHRDEFSETVGYRIKGPNKSALFIPDIDKWEKWEQDIVEEIKRVDYAFIDGTFFSAAEVGHRDISQIPHPFISESLSLFGDLEASEKAKIIFIHFNHTNPVIKSKSAESIQVINAGFNLARLYDVFPL